MKGILYGVGVGPGDPELMTLKACRMIRENEYIAVPSNTSVEDSLAYSIALKAVPELKQKTVISMKFPMTRDTLEAENSHKAAAVQAEKILSKGKNLVFLTLGDPAVYSTFSYLMHYVKADGYEVRMVSGVPSFCAAAAAADIPLAEGSETIGIYPTSDMSLDASTRIIMKSGRKAGETASYLSGCDVTLVENCGMDDEYIYKGVENIPDKCGYFSIMIARQQ